MSRKRQTAYNMVTAGNQKSSIQVENQDKKNI